MQLYQVKGTPEAQVELLATTDCGLVKFRTLLNNEIIESTKEAFELGFEPVKKQLFSFGEAITNLKDGNKVARHGWNGKGMWLKLIEADEYSTIGTSVKETLPWIGMKTADNKFVPWLASQTDMLAEDWIVVE